MRPQAPHLGSDLRYTPLERGGKCPDMFLLGFRVFDSKGRTAVYLPVEESDEMENRPQDADDGGTALGIYSVH
jgi:hypothetical protein